VSKWKIVYTREAGLDLGFFIEKHPRIWEEIRRIIKLLSEEDDPRHPKNSELNVAQIEYDAPGWWRIYVGNPGPFWVRVVFTLIGTRSGEEVEIELRERADEFEAPYIIEITDVVFRENAYGKRLRDRFKNYWRRRPQ
jgi:hypothetical protein